MRGNFTKEKCWWVQPTSWDLLAGFGITLSLKVSPFGSQDIKLSWLSSSSFSEPFSQSTLFVLLHHLLDVWAPGLLFKSLDLLLFCLHWLPWWSYLVSRLMNSKIKMSSPDFSPHLQMHTSNCLHFTTTWMSDPATTLLLYVSINLQ